MLNLWTMWQVSVISHPLFFRKDECEREAPNSLSTFGFKIMTLIKLQNAWILIKNMVMIWSVTACYRYMIVIFPNFLNVHLDLVLWTRLFLWFEKSEHCPCAGKKITDYVWVFYWKQLALPISIIIQTKGLVY